MATNKDDEIKKSAKQESRSYQPFLSKGIYKNYADGMKKKNQERARKGLQAIRVRSFEEWAGQ